MTRLVIYDDAAPGVPVFDSRNPGEIAPKLREIKIGFERWDAPIHIAEGASNDAILEAFRPYLNALMGSTGAGSADVVKLHPEHSQAGPLREKFLAEHTHSEPEIRFFVAGSGHFVLHENGQVFDILCEKDDLIQVPAGIKHWFDAGEKPSFTALRVFTDSSGWVAHYTGDAISSRFPVT